MENRYQKTVARCLIFVCFFLGTQALIYTQALLIPFIFAILIYATLRSAARLLESRLRIPSSFALITAMTLGTLVFLGFFYMVTSSVASFLTSAGVYGEKLAQFPIWINERLAPTGFAINQETIRAAVLGMPFAQYARNVTGTVSGVLSNLALVSIFVLFLLLGGRARRTAEAQSVPLVEEMFIKVSGYVGTKLLLSLLTGCLTAIILFGMGVDLALLFSVLTVILNFIPNVGSIVSVLLPVPILLLQFGTTWETALVLVSTTVVQFAIGNVLEPRIMGKSLALHPVVVLLALVFWGLIWGIPGMFLAVPITAIGKMILSLYETTRSLVALFEGDLSMMNLRTYASEGQPAKNEPSTEAHTGGS